MPHKKEKFKKESKEKAEKKTLSRRIYFISIDKWPQFSHSFLLMLTIYREREKNDMKNWIKLFFIPCSWYVTFAQFLLCFFFLFPFSPEGFLWASEKNYADFFIAQLFACFFFSGLYRLTSKTFPLALFYGMGWQA